MNLTELQFTAAQFRATPSVQQHLMELLVPGTGPDFIEPYRASLILGLNTLKNHALEPKVPISATQQETTNAYWLSRGVVQFLRGLNDLATPIGKPAGDTFKDTELGVELPLDILPPHLRKLPFPEPPPSPT